MKNLWKRFVSLIQCGSKERDSTRKVVVLAWELGGGFGHISRLLAVAQSINRTECDFIYIFRNIEDISIISDFKWSANMRQAPICKTTKNNSAAYNYSDILYRCGYKSHETLEQLVSQWVALLMESGPSLIVSDHSPTAVLAASILGIPIVNIGSGFSTPPSGHPFLPLHPQSSTGSNEREACVLQSIQKVQAQMGVTPIKNIGDLFKGAQTFACCLPELDPYCTTRGSAAIGPVHELPSFHPVPEMPLVFGYLTGLDVRTPEIVASLVGEGVRAGIFIRHMDPVCEDITRGSSVKIYYKPQNMIDALQNASVVLHHGGLSTSETALALGRPQFLIPRNLEQALTTRAIERMECGLNVGGNINDVGKIIRKAVERNTYVKQAAIVSRRISERKKTDVVGVIVSSCLSYLSDETSHATSSLSPTVSATALF